MKKVGILGGGQLGMLLSQSILRLGGEALVFDPDPNAPALRGVRHSVIASWRDEEALLSFFKKCDLVTYEFENVPSDVLLKLAKLKPIYPDLSVLKTTQNRALEKAFLENSQLPHVPFRQASHPSALVASTKGLRFPLVCKSASGGYDGKFQYFIASENALDELAQKLSQDKRAAMLMTIEEAVDLHLELSCITARSHKGEEIAFPIFENIHVNHILDTTLLPARIPPALEKILVEIAFDAARRLGVIGLLCTEFFITKKSTAALTGATSDNYVIYINEFAPRPHNSGHVTMSGTNISQFDALARILLDAPLSQPKLMAPGYFCMANLLGDVWLKQDRAPIDELNLSALAASPEVVDIVIYGKQEARNGRKMGHFVTYSADADEALKTAIAFRQRLNASFN